MDQALQGWKEKKAQSNQPQKVLISKFIKNLKYKSILKTTSYKPQPQSLNQKKG